MKVSVIIPTFNRSSLLASVLSHLEEQTTPPAGVIVSAPDQSHVAPYTPKNYDLYFVFGSKGLCAQRNAAMRQALKTSDIITFFDDDFLPARNYVELLMKAFAQFKELAVVMGTVIADGAKGTGLSFEEGTGILERHQGPAPEAGFGGIKKHVGAYGCNMSIQTAFIRDLRFDERLVLYGWQEDIDFTSQLRRHGDVVQLGNLTGVHLGVKSGRISGVRFGYSQVSNPVYLMLKGTMPFSFGLELMSRNLLANTVKSLRPEPHIDRRGRLRGNLLAMRHLVQGKVRPEYILEL